MCELIVLVGPLLGAAALPIATCGCCIAVSFTSLSISMRNARGPEFLPCPVVDWEGVFALPRSWPCWEVPSSDSTQHAASCKTALVVVIRE